MRYLIILLFAVACTEEIETVKTNDYVEIVNDTIYDTISINRATTYNAVSSQCDDNPLSTADGSIIDLKKLSEQKVRWVALSRDLIKDDYRDGLRMNRNHWRGYFEFGDTITVFSNSSPQINGKWVVHDCMNARYSKSVDFLFDPKNNKPKLGICKDLKIIRKL